MGVEKEQCDTYMVDWQVTATTIHCDAVDDEVTIMVNKDWSAKCTGVRKYTESREEQVNLVRKGLQLRRTLECEGVGCTHIIEYQQKLRDEEVSKNQSTSAPVVTSEEIEPSKDEQ
jgi:hypothetical protein